MKKLIPVFTAIALGIAPVATIAASSEETTFKIHLCPSVDEYYEIFAKNNGKTPDQLSTKEKMMLQDLCAAEHKGHKSGVWFDFSQKIDQPAENSELIVAFYSNGALTNTFKSNCEENADLNKNLSCAETPDAVKVFLWEKGNLRPICASKNVLNASSLTKANAELVKLINDGLAEIHIEQFNGNGRKIINIIKNCAEDAKKQADKHLLTSEYVKSYYEDELLSAKVYYDGLEGSARADFQNAASKISSTEPGAKLIQYLGLESWLTKTTVSAK